MKMTTKELTTTAIMLSLALVFQIVFRVFAQPMVGPLINMVLFLTVLYVNVYAGIAVGTITPIVAFILGIVTIPVLTPVIVIGNCLLVVMFEVCVNRIKKEPMNAYLGVAIAGLFKFIFLYIAVRTLLPLFMTKVPELIYLSFGLSQLYTAVVGGILALLIKTFLPKKIGYKN